MSACTSQPTGHPCHHCGQPAVMVTSQRQPDGTFVKGHHTCADCVSKSLPTPPTHEETAFIIQKRIFTSLGFEHHHTDTDRRATYIGQGLNIRVDSTEADPAQIMLRILEAKENTLKAEARRNLEKIVGPLARI